MKKLLLILLGILHTSSGYCQDTQQLIGKVAQMYTGSDHSGSGLIGGFSMWGLMGGILFGTIGFGVFIYGKRNSEFKPMLIGIALMVCPYFLRGTIALYLAGLGLMAALYFFRE
jgi:hypothetical protein